MNRDWPGTGRPLIHETADGFFYSDTLRAEFRNSDDRMLTHRREFGCLDASETISAGSHKCEGSGFAAFVFR